MKELQLFKDYKDNKKLRKSFNQLALDTFEIEFETWYQQGYWTEKYQPYSFIKDDRVVANVSVNLLDLIINGNRKQAVQIGTVMTHPEYRNQGLSRKLMNIVLEDFKHVDLIYLFANQTVLDFYPKFGFKKIEEFQFTLNYNYKPSVQKGIRKLDGSKSEDLAFIFSLASDRLSVSRIFGTANSEELLMFYCMMVFSQDLYYLEAEKALVIFQHEGDTLHLYDIASKEDVHLEKIINMIAVSETKSVVFHYHPDEPGLELVKQSYHTGNVLFIKNLTNVSLPKEFKHPLTAQA